MKGTVSTSCNLDVECEGNYAPGRTDRFDSNHGNWLPGDRPEIQDFKIYLAHPTGHGRMDITDWLSGSEYEQLYDEFLARAKEICG